MSRGKVYLVGSGPGDPELLTVRARQLLAEADVILHDKLPGPDILDDIDPERREDVGTRGHGDRTPQSYVNERMVELARESKQVVRLKGGDPTVFGRGGEEAQHLADREIPFEFVPGVSSVLATGVTGIPLTHREHASSLTVVTGHEDPEKEESALDWAALADTVDAGGTLVVLMGVGRLPDYATALRERGVDPDTPAAMIQKATLGAEATVTATVASIVEAREEAGIEPPAITVIGDVVSVRGEVEAWLQRAEAEGAGFEPGVAPLAGLANGTDK